MARFDGRTAIVTGAARGIGRACVERLIAEGAKVVIADIDEPTGRATAEKLGPNARFVRCDVGDARDVANLVTLAKAVTGDIDILVNNAGIAPAAEFLDLKEADFDRVLRVNLKGAFLVGQAVAKEMAAQVKASKKPGAIVNMASINSVVAIPNQTSYAASKGGLAQLTRVMAISLAPLGIRVNAVGPGSIMTELLAGIATDREAKRRLLSRTPLGRIGTPAEVAAVVAFLASDDASYITGEIVYVDGGRLALNYTMPVNEKALD